MYIYIYIYKGSVHSSPRPDRNLSGHCVKPRGPSLWWPSVLCQIDLLATPFALLVKRSTRRRSGLRLFQLPLGIPPLWSELVPPWTGCGLDLHCLSWGPGPVKFPGCIFTST